MVFVAVALPKLAHSQSTFYKATIAGYFDRQDDNLLFLANQNNAHCIARAINTIAGAVFTLHARGDVAERMKEFLAVRERV